MFAHAKQALRINLCAFCSPGKLSEAARAERSAILKEPSRAGNDAVCVSLDAEQPGDSLTGKSFGSITALNVFKVGVAHDLLVADARPIDTKWPKDWASVRLSALVGQL